jgi:hypothetical protein
MKRVLLALSVFLSILAMNGCREETNYSALCNNNIKDGLETEIDCGGDCLACPDAATFSCTLGNSSFVSSNAIGQILGPSIRISAVDAEGRPLNFMFIPAALNQPIQISAGGFSYQGEPYYKGSSDTGTVVITAQDTLRKIISGNFGFRGNRIGSGQVASVSNGVFTNVRYK